MDANSILVTPFVIVGLCWCVWIWVKIEAARLIGCDLWRAEGGRTVARCELNAIWESVEARVLLRSHQFILQCPPSRFASTFNP